MWYVELSFSFATHFKAIFDSQFSTFLGNYMLTILVSIMVSLAIEIPGLNIDELLFQDSHESDSNNNDDSIVHDYGTKFSLPPMITK